MIKTVKKISQQADNYFCQWDIRYNRLQQRVDEIVDVILDLLSVPSDTSLDYDIQNDLYYCRDRFYIVLYDYALGYTEYSAEEVLDQLLWLKEE